MSSDLQEMDKNDSLSGESKNAEHVSMDETNADESNLSDAVKNGEEPNTSNITFEDSELEAIKVRVKEMEEEAIKIKEMQNDVEKQMMNTSSTSFPTLEEKIEVDSRSVYVGNVDYGAVAVELESHFNGCGPITRVTILTDKYSGNPKGFAYIEFANKEALPNAILLDESLFRGRQIKVVAKRTNHPGISRSRGRMSRYRGFSRGRRPYYRGYFPRSSRGRAYRSYSPYS